MITIKTQNEIEKMRKAGRIVALALDGAKKAAKPGVTTLELDRIAEDIIRSAGAIPSFKGYTYDPREVPPFPGSICTSVNNQIVHGIPGKYRLKDGDILSLDCGAILDGWNGDAGLTVPVGNVSGELLDLIKVTEQSFWEGYRYAREGYRTGDIGAAVQAYAESYGYSVVREMTGHGIGAEMHEDPDVPNYGRPGHGVRLRRGMCIAVEPMLNMGTAAGYVLADRWTYSTRDGKHSAYFEHTIAITDGEGDILTKI